MDPPPTTVLHHHYEESVESSSPTCRQWDETLPAPKLRMMCSYGGHIIPRPHDKSLCYMGGETRIVVADRHTSLADLCSRLSASLLNGRQFSLKYQLPSEDLDSLVSVTTDEDLDNMMEEYDRLNSSSKPSRLRLFLFLTKPETTASMGSLLDDAKSETWFVDALNGAGLLPRGLSDSATIDNLLEHKDNDPRPLEMETTSSFGSSSSSPSMSNLPPKVDHINQMAGLDEQLSQLNVGGWPTSAVSDDHGSGMRKPPLPLPLPLQPVQKKFANDPYSLPSPDSKYGGACGLHSPDSIASDSSSIASANCQSKTTFTQDSNTQSNRDTPTPPATTQIYPNTTINYQIPIQQIQDSSDNSVTQDQQKQQQQFYQPRPHFIQHHTTNQPVSSYYQVYAQPPPPQIDNQQYPLYFLPVTQNHHYLQSNATDAAAANPATITSAAATPPLYPTKTVIPLNKPDMYGTSAPSMIQVPSNQFQQQYMNASQVPHHPPTPSNVGKYGYDQYVNLGQEPVYYSQHQSVVASLPSQYQTMTPGSAMLLTQVSSAKQPTPENAKQ